MTGARYAFIERRFYMQKYAVEFHELKGFDVDVLLDADRRTEAWREQNGLPAASSPLSRGFFLDVLRGRA